jgi:hypothetical protein
LSKPLVFTVTDQPEHPGLQRLQRSARFWGWDLKVVLQDGWERSNFRAEQLGQLEAFRKWEPRTFLYLDAFDTCFAGPPAELNADTGALYFCGDPLLGEWQQNPEPTRFNDEAFPPVGSGEFRFLNAGVIWGSALVLQELAGDYLQNYGWRVNQDYFNQRYAFETSLGRHRLKVDTKARVALNLLDVRRRQVDRKYNNRFHYLPTDSYPLVLHSPGTGLSEPVAPMPNWIEDLYHG